MSRGWEDQLNRMMRDPFENRRRERRGTPRQEYPAEFYEPLEEPSEEEDE